MSSVGWGLVFGIALIAIGAGLLRYSRERQSNSRVLFSWLWKEPRGRPWFVYRYILGPVLLILMGTAIVVSAVVHLK
jgi:hypothetical protein